MGMAMVCRRILALALAHLAAVAGFESVPCNAATVDCGLDFFAQVYEQFMKVQTEVVIMPFFIRPRLVIFSSSPGQPPDLTLEDLILTAIQRGVHVWILGWDNAASEKLLPYHQDSAFEQLFEAAGHARHRLHLMLDTSRSGVSSLYYLPHIKAYAFDRRVAFVGGLDFAENRLDTPQHVRPDPRLVAVPLDATHVTGNEKPWQDAMVRIDGPAAEHVAHVLVERWWTYCYSEGYARAQYLRPLDAIANAVMGVANSFRQSRWKSYQCGLEDRLPPQTRMGILALAVRSPEAAVTAPLQTFSVVVAVPALQSQGLPKSKPITVEVSAGSAKAVDVRGFRSLDKLVPREISLAVDGQAAVANDQADVTLDLPGGAQLVVRWLPNGLLTGSPSFAATVAAVVPPPAVPPGQECRVLLSGDMEWMAVENPLTETYDVHVDLIRKAKRFILIENQYFSTSFASDSPECANGNVRIEAVLYSGATNMLGQVLLDRLRRAGRRKEDFSVAVIIPLGTEPGSFYPNLRSSYCFEQAVEDMWKKEKFESNWRDYFSFFFLANAVPVPESLGGPGAAFYGIFTHTKAMVVDDEVALLGSANINDRSLRGDRDAEVGVKVTGGPYPKELRDTLMQGHLGDSARCDPTKLLASLHEVANHNAREVHEKMGILFPEGIFIHDGRTEQFFGLKGLIRLDYSNALATLKYPDSRVVAGGGGMDTFQWFLVRGAQPPRLKGLLFPWSRRIWGLPQMTQIGQMFSDEFNWRRRRRLLEDTSGVWTVDAALPNQTLFA